MTHLGNIAAAERTHDQLDQLDQLVVSAVPGLVDRGMAGSGWRSVLSRRVRESTPRQPTKTSWSPVLPDACSENPQRQPARTAPHRAISGDQRAPSEHETPH
ncbi:hypothetical protein AB0F72_41100 [Actinoplanes sp. NPDC023936]|uniref:hypothetical protein n=1 Tax=Actinoplanes sp. NPDC023936 TaxID=3154910 RepID=UPI0033FAFEA4